MAVNVTYSLAAVTLVSTLSSIEVFRLTQGKLLGDFPFVYLSAF